MAKEKFYYLTEFENRVLETVKSIIGNPTIELHQAVEWLERLGRLNRDSLHMRTKMLIMPELVS